MHENIYLENIIAIQEAIAAKSFGQPFSIYRGDVETGHAEADHTITGEIHMGGQEHFYLEPNAHLAIPGECDGLTLYR